jgi:hypothetical protein
MDWSYKAYLLVDSERLERTFYFSVAANLAAKHSSRLVTSTAL